MQTPRSLEVPAFSSAAGVNSQLKPNSPNCTPTERQTAMNASLDFTPDLPDPRSRPTLDLSGPVPTIDGVPVWPIFGATSPAARYGTMSTGDILDSQVLVSKTVDGIDLGSLWDEFSKLLDIYNNHTTKLCDLLRFPVTIPGSAVLQGISSPDFEVSTEYGAPMAAGPPTEAAVLGYRFDHYDLRSSFTWQYLSRATADEVRAVMNSIIAADLKLVNGLTLRRLFNPNPEHTREGFTAYGLWSNDGSMSPPPFLGTNFPPAQRIMSPARPP